MVKTKIITVGKIKEKEMQAIISEYEKRLERYTDFSCIQIPDSYVCQNPSEKEIEAVLKKEGEAIIKSMPSDMTLASMEIKGKKYSSEGLAQLLEDNKISGGICFVIGSSHGLSKEVRDRCKLKISMSDMTFPHNLARLMLTEQIYRGFKILSGERYHK